MPTTVRQPWQYATAPLTFGASLIPSSQQLTAAEQADAAQNQELADQALYNKYVPQNKPSAPGYYSSEDMYRSVGPMSPYATVTGVNKFINQPLGPGQQKFQGQALSDQYSPWVDVQRQSIGLDAQRANQDLQSRLAGQTASTYSQMAQGRGLSQGAQGRLGRAAIQAQAAGVQGNNMAQNQAMQGVYATDIQNRQNQLQTLAGNEQNQRQFNTSAWAAANNSDLARAQQEAQLKTAYDLNRYNIESNNYNQGLNAWAASQLANKSQQFS